MTELERNLRRKMGNSTFEEMYKSAFATLKADRYGDYPTHEVVLFMVQDMYYMQHGHEPMFMPFGAPGVPTPEPDSKRILRSGRGGGCYIATAVYGSYDCPQVWTLRRYRDDSLTKSRGGRLFIRIYYAISPIMVKSFGRSVWFQRFWRRKLDCFVKKLKANGVDDTPYKD